MLPKAFAKKAFGFLDPKKQEKNGNRPLSPLTGPVEGCYTAFDPRGKENGSVKRYAYYAYAYRFTYAYDGKAICVAPVRQNV